MQKQIHFIWPYELIKQQQQNSFLSLNGYINGKLMNSYTLKCTYHAYLHAVFQIICSNILISKITDVKKKCVPIAITKALEKYKVNFVKKYTLPFSKTKYEISSTLSFYKSKPQLKTSWRYPEQHKFKSIASLTNLLGTRRRAALWEKAKELSFP